MFDHGCLVYFFFCPSPQGATAPEAGAGARQIQKAGASAAAEGATVISVAAVGGSRGCCARAAPSHSASPSIPPPFPVPSPHGDSPQARAAGGQGEEDRRGGQHR